MTQKTSLRRRLFAHRSVFLTTTLIVALCTAVVTVSLEVMLFQLTREHAEHGVKSLGAETTRLVAQHAAGGIEAENMGALNRLFADTIAQSKGAATAAAAFQASGALVHANGASPEVQSQLSEVAGRALAEGEMASSADGFVIAVPARMGENGDILGAVSIRWSPESQIAMLIQEMILPSILTAVLFFVFTGAAAFFLRRHVSQPLVALRDAMARVAEADYGTAVPGIARRDEIGAIARTLETFRHRLEEAAKTAHDNLFKGAAFEGSTAAMMMIDGEARVQYLNDACRDLLEAFGWFFAGRDPEFDAKSLVGRSVFDFLEKTELSIDAEPGAADARVGDICAGDMRLQLTVSVVCDDSGQQIGHVLEWKDVTEERLNKAALDTIDAQQIRVEFSVEGRLSQANDNFARAVGAPLDSLRDAAIADLFGAYSTQKPDAEIDLAGLSAGASVSGRFSAGWSGERRAIFEGGFTRVEDAMQRPLRIVFIGNDITQSQAEIESSEAKRTAMEQAQAEVVSALSVSLGRLAEGDLTASIEAAFSEEYEGLRGNFNEALNRLWSAMNKVIESAELIGNEARDISAAADDLSHRTERQAATLEETAAAVDELTTSVKSAASGASQASQMAVSARTSAQKSEDVVRDTVSAMGEIAQSSTEIAKIINVIEDIAFQTNLLALNAGVEAARAGDSGRGFAVVASEVRALAQRSSEAAQEINALISTSGAQVKRGVGLVDQMGGALGDIVASVTEISTHVTGIATSVQKQSGSLEEINTAMSQLDRVTQQNAAMFEETTAASHALTSEARSLANTTTRFVVSGARTDEPARQQDPGPPEALSA